MSSRSPRVPERLCVSCRILKPRGELFRLVKPTQGDQIIPNPEGAVSGKGFYICRQAACLKKLQKDKRLRKNFCQKLSAEAKNWLEQELAAEEAKLSEISTPSCDEEVKDL